MLIIDFVLQIFNLIGVAENEYFTPIYLYGLLIIFLIFSIGTGMVFYYLCARDSPESRSVYPHGLLIASIASFLMVAWILVYFSFLYPRDKVYVKKVDGQDKEFMNDEEHPGHYSKVSKPTYIISTILTPLINALVYLLFWWDSKAWVKRHENQQKAHG